MLVCFSNSDIVLLQTLMNKITPPKKVVAKVERHRSSENSVPSPYPVSRTPSQHDLSVKVSRSQSLGADANFPKPMPARGGIQEPIVQGSSQSVTPPYSHEPVTSKAQASSSKPGKAEKNSINKERALSVDSALIAPVTTVPASDVAKPVSTNSLQMRPVQYPVTSQRK